MKYLINTIYSCIQGEGVQAGIPMMLVRLQGCGVACPWCDTKETWEINSDYRVNTIFEAQQNPLSYVELHQSEIVKYIDDTFPAITWILLTGGEPAEQELKPLVDALHDAKFKVALETSGTAYFEADLDWVCVSPKINMPGGKVVLSEVLQLADEIKMVIGKRKDIDLLDDLIFNNQLKSNVQILLQPVSQSEKATQLCLSTVMERNWRLSLQIHKYLSLP